MMFLKEEYSLMNCLECGYYTRSHGFNWRRRFELRCSDAQVPQEWSPPEIRVDSEKEISNTSNDDDDENDDNDDVNIKVE